MTVFVETMLKLDLIEFDNGSSIINPPMGDTRVFHAIEEEDR